MAKLEDYATLDTSGFRENYSREYLERLHRYESTPPDDRNPEDDPGPREFLDFDESKCGELPAKGGRLRAQSVMETADAVNLLEHPFDFGTGEGGGEDRRLGPHPVHAGFRLVWKGVESDDVEVTRELLNRPDLPDGYALALAHGLGASLSPDERDEAKSCVKSYSRFGRTAAKSRGEPVALGRTFKSEGEPGSETGPRIPVSMLPWWILAATAHFTGKFVPEYDAEEEKYSGIPNEIFVSGEPSGVGRHDYPDDRESPGPSASEEFDRRFAASCVISSSDGAGAVDERKARRAWSGFVGPDPENGKFPKLDPNAADWVGLSGMFGEKRLFVRGEFLLHSDTGRVTSRWKTISDGDPKEISLPHDDVIDAFSKDDFATRTEAMVVGGCDAVTMRFAKREVKDSEHEFEFTKYDPVYVMPQSDKRIGSQYEGTLGNAHSADDRPEDECFVMTRTVGWDFVTEWEEAMPVAWSSDGFDPSSLDTQNTDRTRYSGCRMAVYIRPTSKRVEITGATLVLERTVTSHRTDVKPGYPARGFDKVDTANVALSKSGKDGDFEIWQAEGGRIDSIADPASVGGGDWKTRDATVTIGQLGVMVKFRIKNTP